MHQVLATSGEATEPERKIQLPPLPPTSWGRQVATLLLLTQLGVAPQPSSYKSTDIKPLGIGLPTRSFHLTNCSLVKKKKKGPTQHHITTTAHVASQCPGYKGHSISTHPTKTQSCHSPPNPFGLLETKRRLSTFPFHPDLHMTLSESMFTGSKAK